MLILEVFAWLTQRNLISFVDPLLVFRSSLEFSFDAVTLERLFSSDCLSCDLSPFDVFLLLGSHIVLRGYHPLSFGAFSTFLTSSRRLSTQ